MVAQADMVVLMVRKQIRCGLRSRRLGQRLVKGGKKEFWLRGKSTASLHVGLVGNILDICKPAGLVRDFVHIHSICLFIFFLKNRADSGSHQGGFKHNSNSCSRARPAISTRYNWRPQCLHQQRVSTSGSMVVASASFYETTRWREIVRFCTSGRLVKVSPRTWDPHPCVEMLAPTGCRFNIQVATAPHLGRW